MNRSAFFPQDNYFSHTFAAPQFQYSQDYGDQFYREEEGTVLPNDNELPKSPAVTQLTNQPQQSKPTKWTDNETKYLVQLWTENLFYIESKDSRKTWKKIAIKLSQKFAILRSADQCNRKIKHLKDKYKEVKDWNRTQTGGNRRTSPFFEDFDRILGCKDSQTLNHVDQVGVPNKETGTDADIENSSEGTDAASGTSTGNEDEVANRVNSRTQRKKNVKRKHEDEREEEERKVFKETIDAFKTQGEVLTRAVENMQETQTRQLDMMNNFIGVFSNFLNKTA